MVRHWLYGGMLIALMLCNQSIVTAKELAPGAIRSLAEEFNDAPVTSFAVARDQQGFIWFANEADGLQRFDGYSLQTFSIARPDEDASQISASAVLVDDKDQIWVGTWGNGLAMLSPDRQLVQHWSLPEPQMTQTATQTMNPVAASERNKVQMLFQDAQNRLWIGSTSGIFYLDAQLQLQQLPTAIDSQFQQARFWQMSQDEQGQLWFATSAGLFQLSADLTGLQSKTAMAPLFMEQSSRFQEIRSLLCTAQGVWFANSEALYFLDYKTNNINLLPNQSLQLGRLNRLWQTEDKQLLIAGSDGLYLLKAPFSYRQQLNLILAAVDARDVLQQPDGLIWLSTRNRGVFQLSLRQPRFKPLQDLAGQSWFADGLTRITSQLYAQGTLWIGLEHAVLSYQLAQQKWQLYVFPEQSGVGQVSTLATDAAGKLWAGTNAGLYRLEPKQGLVAEFRPFAELQLRHNSNITAMTFHPDGSLYLAIFEKGLFRWQPAEQNPVLRHYPIATSTSDAITQIQHAAGGQIWLTTVNSGLYRLNTSDQSITHYYNAADATVRLPTNNISCVSPTTEGLWLCSDRGLLLLQPQLDQLSQFGTAAGLPDARVIAIDVSQPDALWISTRRGLARMDLKTRQFRSFAEQDGIPSLLLEPRALSVDANGVFYLGTAQGILSFLPRLLQPEPNHAKLALTSLQVDQQQIWRADTSELKPLRIPAQHKMLHIEFSFLDFHHSKLHQYRYRLVGLSDAWHDLKVQNSVSFNQLAAGKYQLEIEVVNASSQIPPLKLYLQIDRPWWQFKIVWLLSMLTALVLIALFIQFRIYRFQRTTQKLNLLVQQRTADLATANDRLAAQARTDYLTKLANRLAFSEQFELLMRQRQRQQFPICLAMLDIDFFKKINDQYGHEAGDIVLEQVADTLKQRLRQQDLIARYGGEEFILLLPETDHRGALVICNTLRQSLQLMTISYQQQKIKLTATFGLVEIASSPTELSFWQNAADQALYHGKQHGRNQVVLFSDLPANRAQPPSADQL